MMNIKKSILLLILMGLASISFAGSPYNQQQDSAPLHAVDLSNVQAAVPQALPKSKYGNPSSYVVFGKRYYLLKTAKGFNQRGVASWYGTKFNGHKTSSGTPYDMYAMTAAMKTIPIPSYVRVTNLHNHKSIIVKVNDRGPFRKNRLIDLSYAAAAKLDMLPTGTAHVLVTYINPKLWKEHHSHIDVNNTLSDKELTSDIPGVKADQEKDAGYQNTIDNSSIS